MIKEPSFNREASDSDFVFVSQTANCEEKKDDNSDSEITGELLFGEKKVGQPSSAHEKWKRAHSDQVQISKRLVGSGSDDFTD